MIQRAFTLIELLVVIAILAILATFAVPGISTIQERSRGAQCLGNLQQYAAGVNAYATDWNGKLPGLRALRGSYGSYNSIEGSLFDKYMGVDAKLALDNDQKFLKCPAFFRLTFNYWGKLPSQISNNQSRGRRYELNAGINQWCTSYQGSIVSISMLHPSMALYFCAAGDYTTGQGVLSGWGAPETWVRVAQFPHKPKSSDPYVDPSYTKWPLWWSGNTNVLHIDGHVSTLAMGPVDTGNPWGLPVVTTGSGATLDYDDSKYVAFTSGFGWGQPKGLYTGSGTATPGTNKYNCFWGGQVR